MRYRQQQLPPPQFPQSLHLQQPSHFVQPSQQLVQLLPQPPHELQQPVTELRQPEHALQGPLQQSPHVGQPPMPGPWGALGSALGNVSASSF